MINPYEFTKDCRGDVRVGDVIYFTERAWNNCGERRVVARVLNAEYDDFHNLDVFPTFTLKIVNCEGVDPIAIGARIQRKHHKIYRDVTRRKVWENEVARNLVDLARIHECAKRQFGIEVEERDGGRFIALSKYDFSHDFRWSRLRNQIVVPAADFDRPGYWSPITVLDAMRQTVGLRSTAKMRPLHIQASKVPNEAAIVAVLDAAGIKAYTKSHRTPVLDDILFNEEDEVAVFSKTGIAIRLLEFCGLCCVDWFDGPPVKRRRFVTPRWTAFGGAFDLTIDELDALSTITAG